MLTENIKNIIFDLGGVILDLDLEAAYKEFSRLSELPVEEVIRRTKGLMLFEDYETGSVSSGVFRHQINRVLDMQAKDDEIDHAWSAMLGGIPTQRLELAGQLRQSYRTFVLSNTNEIHVGHFDSIIQDHFEKVYYSHELKMRKPNIEIYEAVLSEQSLNASETLFIDDTLDNIKGAEKLNIKTFHLESPQQLTRLFHGAL